MTRASITFGKVNLEEVPPSAHLDGNVDWSVRLFDGVDTKPGSGNDPIIEIRTEHASYDGPLSQLYRVILEAEVSYRRPIFKPIIERAQAEGIEISVVVRAAFGAYPETVTGRVVDVNDGCLVIESSTTEGPWIAGWGGVVSVSPVTQTKFVAAPADGRLLAAVDVKLRAAAEIETDPLVAAAIRGVAEGLIDQEAA